MSAKNDAGFAGWMEKVDRAVGMIAGLGAYDLSDMNYRDMYDAGDSPSDAAKAALVNADF